jgi:hypothetical protein
MRRSNSDRPEIGQVSWLDEEIAEVSLLMPSWQAALLVAIATRQRVTVGQLLRDLVKIYLAKRTPGNKRQESEVLTPCFFEEGYGNDDKAENSPFGINATRRFGKTSRAIRVRPRGVHGDR